MSNFYNIYLLVGRVVSGFGIGVLEEFDVEDDDIYLFG